MTTSKNCLTPFSNGKSLWRNLFYGSPEDCKNILDNRIKNISNIREISNANTKPYTYEIDNEPLSNIMSYINDYTNSLNMIPSEFSIEYYLDRMDYNKNKNNNDTNNNVSYNEDNIEYEDYIYFMENYEQISNYNTSSIYGSDNEEENLSDGTIYSDNE